MPKSKGKSYLRRIVLLALSINLAFVACATIPIAQKGGGDPFSGDESCSVPCFLGIKPDITTRRQAIDLLGKGGLGCDVAQAIITCGHPMSVTITIDSKGYVDEISFLPRNFTSVKDLINRYGNPDSLDVVTEVTTADTWKNKVALYYDAIHVYLRLESQETADYQLTPYSVVSEVYYLSSSPASIHYYNSFKTLSMHRVDWNGYATYSDPSPNDPALEP